MYTWTPGDQQLEWVTDLVLAAPGFRVELRRVGRMHLDARIATGVMPLGAAGSPLEA